MNELNKKLLESFKSPVCDICKKKIVGVVEADSPIWINKINKSYYCTNCQRWCWYGSSNHE
jgi:hypothetical protein